MPLAAALPRANMLFWTETLNVELVVPLMPTALSYTPAATLLLVIVALANIALPLTNAFIGEFMMFSGIYSSVATQYNVVFTAIATITIILSAVYMLNMIQKVFYGNTNALTANGHDIRMNEKIILAVIVVLILVLGVYPQPIFELTKGTVESILSKMSYKQ